MAAEGVTVLLCGACEGEIRETTGFYSTPRRTHRKSRRFQCCRGQPFRGCPDRRPFVADGPWLASAVETWLLKSEFRTALERNPALSMSAIGQLRYRLDGTKTYWRGIEFWAFSQAIWKLQRDVAYLGDYQRQTGAAAADHVVRFAVQMSQQHAKVA